MHSNKHFSVLKNEIIDSLNINPNGIYVDATMGRGGHSLAILKKISNQGMLICIDQDEDAIQYCYDLFCEYKNVKIIKDNFSNITKILNSLSIQKIDGLIVDLGVSSPQLDNAHRGFSYKNNGPLDMRMNQTSSLSAYTVLNTYTKEKLINIFKNYGDIKNPKILVDNIIKQRSIKPIATTFDFFELIKKSVPPKLFYQNSHFCNSYFQAIRIEVNDEMNSLNSILNSLNDILKINGIACFITFHSLEDKIVLKKFKELSSSIIPREIPLQIDDRKYILIQPKGILPSDAEIKMNNRSRSAKLRIIKKIV